MDSPDIWRNCLNNSEKVFFVLKELLHSCASGRALKIHFSPSKDWERHIRKFFKFTKHQISFGDFSRCRLEDFDMLVPLGVKDTLFLDEKRDRLSRNLIPVPTAESVNLCNDKNALNRVLKENGFAEIVPSEKIEPPFILKKKSDGFGKGCHFIQSEIDIRKFNAELASDSYFSQQFIPGNTEYATHILRTRKGIAAALCIRYEFADTFPIKGKNAPLRRCLDNCNFLSTWDDILAMINYEGLCCINYKIADGKPMFFEINPRFGGSLAPFFFAFVRKVNSTSVRSSDNVPCVTTE